MSAVEEYRLAADRWEVDSHDHGDEAVNAADAAIAELEEGNERLKWMLDTLIADFDCAEMVGAYTEDLNRRWTGRETP